MLRNDGYPGFNTPTGKVELKSSIYPDWDEDPLPYFQEPPFSPYSDRIDEQTKKDFPIVLTTGGRQLTYFHSESRHVPSLRKIIPDPIVSINPKLAAQYGIEEGNWVCIESPFGQCIQKAHLTQGMDPRVIHCVHGWWFPEENGESPNLYGTYKANVNNLVPHHVNGKMGWGAPYKSMICRIRKVNSMDDWDPNYPERPYHVSLSYSLDQKTLKEQGDI